MTTSTTLDDSGGILVDFCDHPQAFGLDNRTLVRLRLRSRRCCFDASDRVSRAPRTLRESRA